MSGADSPRWRQNRPESPLPHIITGLDPEHLVSLPSFAVCLYEYPSQPQTPLLQSKSGLFDKIKGLLTQKSQSRVYEPVLPLATNVTENAHSEQVRPSSRLRGILDKQPYLSMLREASTSPPWTCSLPSL
jgi:hypothetical protein